VCGEHARGGAPLPQRPLLADARRARARAHTGACRGVRQAVQAERALINIRAKASDMDRHSYLTSLQARAPGGRAPTAAPGAMCRCVPSASEHVRPCSAAGRARAGTASACADRMLQAACVESRP